MMAITRSIVGPRSRRQAARPPAAAEGGRTQHQCRKGMLMTASSLLLSLLLPLVLFLVSCSSAAAIVGGGGGASRRGVAATTTTTTTTTTAALGPASTNHHLPLMQRFVAASPGSSALGSASGPGAGLRGQLQQGLQQGWEKAQGELEQWGERIKANPREAAKAAGVAVAALLGGAVIRSPNVRRQSTFWFRAFPVYAHYRLTELVMRLKGLDQEEQNKVWDKLHARHADEMLTLVKRLKGYYVKVCQFSSSRLDILPHLWIEKFATLQDDVPPKPAPEIIRIVEKSYGKPIDEVFESFDAEHPLGSASIGQCHLARLKGSGKLVAVKIMYPEAEACFNSDMKTLRSFARIAQPAYVSMLDEVRRQFMKEFDYRKEAANQDAIRIGLSQAGYDRSVVVPKPYPELCTREVLVMDYLPGVKLTDVVRQRPKANGNAAQPTAGTAGAGAAAVPSGESWWGRTIGAYFNRRYARSLVDEVVRVHGHQILKMGLFNGDPHPGNLLLMPSGKLGLIDYGQIKALKPEQRRAMARIIVALADGKEQEVIDLFVKMGFRSKKMDPEVISAVASLYFDRDDEKITKGINLQVFFEKLQQRDPFIAFPEDFIMVARVAVFMRGLGTFMQHPISIARAWRPLAVEVLKEKDLAAAEAA